MLPISFVVLVAEHVFDGLHDAVVLLVPEVVVPALYVVFIQYLEERLGIVLEEVRQGLHGPSVVLVAGVVTAVRQHMVHQPQGLVGVVRGLQIGHGQVGTYHAYGVRRSHRLDGLLAVVSRHLVVAAVLVDGSHRGVYHVEVAVALLAHLFQHLLGQPQRLVAVPYVYLVGHLVHTVHVVALPAAVPFHDVSHLLVHLLELGLAVRLSEQLVVAFHHRLLVVGVRVLGPHRQRHQHQQQ